MNKQIFTIAFIFSAVIHDPLGWLLKDGFEAQNRISQRLELGNVIT